MNINSDIPWIKQVLDGNTNAFRNIVNTHKDRAFNLAFRICRNREEAEEIIQDSFMKAYRSLGDFRMDSSFTTWFYRIVYNTSVSFLRTKKDNNINLDADFAEKYRYSEINSYEYEAESEYNRILVNKALGKLNDEERGIISLFYYDELSLNEIAAITGDSVSNIKVKLHRSRKIMSEALTSNKTREVNTK